MASRSMVLPAKPRERKRASRVLRSCTRRASSSNSRRIGEHERGQVVAVRRHPRLALLVAHLQEVRALPQQAERRRADQGDAPELRPRLRRDMARDQRPEGEAGEIKGRALAPQHARQPRPHHGGDRRRAVAARRHVGIAEARQVRTEQPPIRREPLDVAHPMAPGAGAAVEQHQRRPPFRRPPPPPEDGPHSRQTMAPSPQGVSCRRARASHAASTASADPDDEGGSVVTPRRGW